MRVSVGATASALSPIDYDNLLETGWMRSGTHMYLPDNETSCCPNLPIRVDATRFEPNKEQRSTLKHLSEYLSGKRPITITEPDDDEGDVLDRILALANEGQTDEAAEACYIWRTTGKLVLRGVEQRTLRSAPTHGDAHARMDGPGIAGAAPPPSASAHSAADDELSSLSDDALAARYVAAVSLPLARDYLATTGRGEWGLTQEESAAALQKIAFAPPPFPAKRKGQRQQPHAASAGARVYAPEEPQAIVASCNAAFVIAAAVIAAAVNRGEEVPSRASLQTRVAGELAKLVSDRAGEAAAASAAYPAPLCAAESGPGFINLRLALPVPAGDDSEAARSAMRAYVSAHGHVSAPSMTPATAAASAPAASSGPASSLATAASGLPLEAPSDAAAIDFEAPDDDTPCLPVVNGKSISSVNAETPEERAALAAHYRRQQYERERRGKELLRADPFNPRSFRSDDDSDVGEDDSNTDSDSDSLELSDIEKGEDVEMADAAVGGGGDASASGPAAGAHLPAAPRLSRAKRRAAARASRAAEARAHSIGDMRADIVEYLRVGMGALQRGMLERARAGATPGPDGKPQLLPFGPGPHSLTVTLRRPYFSSESWEIYTRFNMALHCGTPHSNTERGFTRHLATSPITPMPAPQVGFLYRAATGTLGGSRFVQPAPEVAQASGGDGSGASSAAPLPSRPTICDDFAHIATALGAPHVAPSPLSCDVLLEVAMQDAHVAWLLQALRRSLPHAPVREAAGAGPAAACSATGTSLGSGVDAFLQQMMQDLGGARGSDQEIRAIVEALTGTQPTAGPAAQPSASNDPWAAIYAGLSLTPVPPLPLPLAELLLVREPAELEGLCGVPDVSELAFAAALFATAAALHAEARALEAEAQRAVEQRAAWEARVSAAQRELDALLQALSSRGPSAGGSGSGSRAPAWSGGGGGSTAAPPPPLPRSPPASDDEDEGGGRGGAGRGRDRLKRVRIDSHTSGQARWGDDGEDDNEGASGGDDGSSSGSSSSSERVEQLSAEASEPQPASFMLPPGWGRAGHVRALFRSTFRSSRQRLQWLEGAVGSLLQAVQSAVERFGPGGADDASAGAMAGVLLGMPPPLPPQQEGSSGAGSTTGGISTAKASADKTSAFLARYLRPLPAADGSLPPGTHQPEGADPDLRIAVGGWDLSLGFGSFFHEYRLDGALVAVSVLDVLPTRVASVYFSYLPGLRYLQLGKASALVELWLTRQIHAVTAARPEVLGLPAGAAPICRHWDPNFIVSAPPRFDGNEGNSFSGRARSSLDLVRAPHRRSSHTPLLPARLPPPAAQVTSCAAMSYKRHFHPAQVQCPAMPRGAAWVDLTHAALAKLDADPVAPLASIPTEEADGSVAYSSEPRMVRAIGDQLRAYSDAQADAALEDALHVLPEGKMYPFRGLADSSRVLLQKGETQFARALGEDLLSRTLVDPLAVAHVWNTAQRAAKQREDRREARRAARAAQMQQNAGAGDAVLTS